MALQICGGNAFIHSEKSNESTTTPTASKVSEPKTYAPQPVLRSVLSTTPYMLFQQNAFAQVADEQPADIYNECTISYHKLSDHEDPRQVLRDINCKTGGTFTQEQMIGICDNLGRFFDIHYILHGGILTDFRFYDPFGDYIQRDLLTCHDHRFTDWQMHVFDTEDNMYAYGLDDQMITDVKNMFAHQIKQVV